MVPGDDARAPSGTPRHAPEGSDAARGLVVDLRFRADDPQQAVLLLGRLREAVGVLSAFDGFIDGVVGRATDDGLLLMVALSWRAVGDYRRALSSYDVKVSVVPLLSTAVDEPSAFEVLHERDSAGSRDAAGALAEDAGRVSLGSAAAPFVPPLPS